MFAITNLFQKINFLKVSLKEVKLERDGSMDLNFI
jgi:hypothetical protein